MKRARLIYFALSLSSLLLTVSGCWDYLEYENMVQVDAVGIDFNKATKEITMTVEYLQPGKGGGGGMDSTSKSASRQEVVRSATDWMVTAALDKLQQGIGKRLFFGYLRLEVISEDAAKHIMRDLMEFADRTPELRSTANVVITPGKAEEILSTIDPEINTPPGRAIAEMISTARYNGVTFPVSIQHFNEMLALSGMEAVIPGVKMTVTAPSLSNRQSIGVVGGGNGDGGTIKGPKIKEGHHWVEGMAVFKEDRMVGWLNPKESKGWGWLTGQKIYSYEMGKSGKIYTGAGLCFRVIGSGRKIKPRLDKGEPVIDVKVKVDAFLLKYYDSRGTRYLKPDLIRLLEKELALGVAKDIRAALHKGQKDLKSDIFGFGFAFYRRYPYLWRAGYQKKWPGIFPGIPVHLKVQAKVINTGTNIRQLIVK